MTCVAGAAAKGMEVNPLGKTMGLCWVLCSEAFQCEAVRRIR